MIKSVGVRTYVVLSRDVSDLLSGGTVDASLPVNLMCGLRNFRMNFIA